MSYKFFLTSFISLEKTQNDSNISNFLNTIDNELKNLKNTTVDYSNWDDSYYFIKDSNKKYIYENFREGSETLNNININAILYVNLENKILFSTYEDKYLESNKNDFEKFIIDKTKDKSNLNTIINFNSLFIYLSKSEILKSDKTGDVNGFIISIKLLDNEFITNNTIFEKIEIKNEKAFNSDKNIDFPLIKNIKIETKTTYEYILNKIDFFDTNNEFVISINTLNQRELVNNAERTLYIFNLIVSIVLFLILFFIYKNQRLIQNQNESLNKEVTKRTTQLDKAFRKLKDKNKELYSLAHIDSLTKIQNRRSFFMQSEEALIKCIKNKKDLCILLIDLDHFKSINDTYGHASGDRVLIEFCHIVNSIIDEKAIFGRIGGEEFCITFINKSIDDVNAIAEEIRTNCANTQIELEDNTKLNFTVSMGLRCKNGLDNIDKILQKSDELLYEAKKTGRNRIIRYN
jgi:diguanylate cyclase (GGDEF)-like protein